MRKKVLSATAMVVLFSILSFLAILAYRWVFPGKGTVVPSMLFHWRLSSAVQDFIISFPAIALAAIMGSFGLADDGSRQDGRRFSLGFLETMTGPLIACIVAAAAYAALYLLALPVARDWHMDIAAKSSFYEYSYRTMLSAANEGDWKEASRRIAVCDALWPDSEEISRLVVTPGGVRRMDEDDDAARQGMLSLRDQLRVELSALHAEADESEGRGSPSGQKTQAGTSMVKFSATSLAPGGAPAPVSAAQALAIAERELAAGKNFDAHWYATLAVKLSPPGDSLAAKADRVASEAWNAIATIAPDEQEVAAHRLFLVKRSGYEALQSGEWVRAYYIFDTYLKAVPDDSEAPLFLVQSERGAAKEAFFLDEATYSLGQVYSEVLFSLPSSGGGRDLLFAQRLNWFRDAAYVEGLTAASYAPTGRRLWAVTARYAKLVPLSVAGVLPSKGVAADADRSVLLLVALDREDGSKRIVPSFVDSVAPGDADNRLLLQASFEDLGLAAEARRDSASLSLVELDRASDRLEPLGFRSELFKAESLQRLTDPFTFLWVSVFALAFGWRLRSRARIGFALLPVMIVLPFVVDVPLQAIRRVSGMLSVAAVISLPYAVAMPLTLVAEGLLFAASLVFLAGQRAE